MERLVKEVKINRKYLYISNKQYARLDVKSGVSVIVCNAALPNGSINSK